MGAFGKGVEQLGNLMRASSKRLKEGVEVNANANMRFAETMENLWAEAWNPLRDAFLEFYPKIRESTIVVTNIFKVLSTQIADFIETLVPGVRDMDKFKESLVHLSIVGVEFMGRAFDQVKLFANFFLNEAILPLADATLRLVEYFTRMEGAIDSIFNHLPALMTAGLRAQGFVTTGGAISLGAGLTTPWSVADDDKRDALTLGDRLQAALAEVASVSGHRWTEGLHDLLASMEGGFRTTGINTGRTARAAETIQDELVEPTIPAFLDQSIGVMAENLERVLGVTPTAPGADLEEVITFLQQIATNTEDPIGPPSPFPR